MNGARSNLAPNPAPAAPSLSRRQRRRQAESRQITGKLCAVGLAAVALVTYVFGQATVTRNNYQRERLQARYVKLQSERKLLEAQVADLQRIDRVLFLAKQQGMEPSQSLQYVSLENTTDNKQAFIHP